MSSLLAERLPTPAGVLVTEAGLASVTAGRAGLSTLLCFWPASNDAGPIDESRTSKVEASGVPSKEAPDTFMVPAVDISSRVGLAANPLPPTGTSSTLATGTRDAASWSRSGSFASPVVTATGTRLELAEELREEAEEEDELSDEKLEDRDLVPKGFSAAPGPNATSSCFDKSVCSKAIAPAAAGGKAPSAEALGSSCLCPLELAADFALGTTVFRGAARAPALHAGVKLSRFGWWTRTAHALADPGLARSARLALGGGGEAGRNLPEALKGRAVSDGSPKRSEMLSTPAPSGAKNLKTSEISLTPHLSHGMDNTLNPTSKSVADTFPFSLRSNAFHALE
mmetsp:Transcript_75725/g.202591  ORF Transcript_75725/g.202591 Transcript_75725/m.202591 type:complete len:340 (+) Transcript_75725:446-1465(+)